MNNSSHHTRHLANEQGFVLILSLVMLVLLTLLGLWALQTSDFENRIASNAQQAEGKFHVSEAANYTEAANVNYGRRDFYNISNPYETDIQLLPKSITNTDYNIDAVKAEDEASWPLDNFKDPAKGDKGELKLEANREPAEDYNYLVTYFGADTASMGYAAEQFTAYRFRIQGSKAETNRESRGPTIETGCKKTGLPLQL